jgi:hypothetical protein
VTTIFSTASALDSQSVLLGLGVAIERTVSECVEACREPYPDIMRAFSRGVETRSLAAHQEDSWSCRHATWPALASGLLVSASMDKDQDADLEKGYETIENAYGEDERSLFDTDEDLFEAAYDENEYEYEPEGAFLD